MVSVASVASFFMTSRPSRIAIIGAGPAGTTLAMLLARKGAQPVIFDDGKRPELIVGESLIPLMVTIFQRLGLEERVKSFGIWKPGVTFTIDDETEFPLSFGSLQGVLPMYAYNVPRKEFDTMLLEEALKAGVTYLQTVAKLERVDPPATGGGGAPVVPSVRLAPETLAQVPQWEGQPPDLIVDASGRRRLLAKLLGVTAQTGPRKDVAHVAHFVDCTRPTPEGQVVISRLKHGWSWQIPLNEGRLSVGVVLNKDDAKEYGSTPEEVLNGVIERNGRLAKACAHRRRVSPVATYTNYQLISDQGCGPNWVMAGDAYGFVDPMLSPGLAMAMVSAERLADLIPATWPDTPHALDAKLQEYVVWFREFLAAWQELIDLFYNGTMFALYMTGLKWQMKFPRLMEPLNRHISKNLAGMASGAYTTRPYSRGLLRWMAKYGMQYDPAGFVIR